MKGGYNGTSERRGDKCPICQSGYDRYYPADDDFEPRDDVNHVCVVVNHGNYASGAYVHDTGTESPENVGHSRSMDVS